MVGPVRRRLLLTDETIRRRKPLGGVPPRSGLVQLYKLFSDAKFQKKACWTMPLRVYGF